MVDLEPATRVLSGIVGGVRDDQLDAPTPCTEASVGDLLDHVDGLALAFTAAAQKRPLEGAAGPTADGSRLGTAWRGRIVDRLATLAEAWREDSAWAGMTEAGGVELPGEIAGLVALDEVVVHGWDIAVATGQPFRCEPPLVEAAYEFVRSAVDENPDGSPGLFGPPVSVDEGAPLLDRLIGLTGRLPTWRATGSGPSTDVKRT